jgi:hypothetical protein
MSWISSDAIRVPTTAAALLRNTVENSRPIAAIARIGIRYTSRLAPSSTSPRPGWIVVPERVGSALKPDTTEPATTATVPVSRIAAMAYVAVASTFAPKTCERSTERVRIVFSVPL